MTGPSRDDQATLTGPSRDDRATLTCPVCQRHFAPVGRQRYCCEPSRKTAFRRRHEQQPTPIGRPAARPRRAHTVYECPDCGERLLGDQRCPDCGVFARRIGIGGPCPHCLLTELADVAGVSFPSALLHLDAWPTSTASLKLILR
jgi:ribosomal protein L32